MRVARPTYRLPGRAACLDIRRVVERPRRLVALALEWTDEGHLHLGKYKNSFTGTSKTRRTGVVYFVRWGMAYPHPQRTKPTTRAGQRTYAQ